MLHMIMKCTVTKCITALAVVHLRKGCILSSFIQAKRQQYDQNQHKKILLWLEIFTSDQDF